MRRPSSILVLVSAASLSLASSGCSGEPEYAIRPATLTRAASCEALLATLKDDARAQMNAAIDAEIEALRQPEDAWFGGWKTHGMEDFGVPAMSGSEAAPNAGPDYSDTNVQVEGVDEADLVKTDGYFLYVLHGDKLVIASAWPASGLGLASETQIEGRARELFVAGDKLVVFSDLDGEPIWSKAGVPPAKATGLDDGPEWGEPSYPDPQHGMTKMTVLGIEGAEPSVLAEHYFEGSYHTARRVGSQVRLVLDGGHQAPTIQLWPSDYVEDTDDQIDALEDLRDKNEAAISAATIADFVPRRFVKNGPDVTLVPPSCESFYVPTIGTTVYGVTQLHAIDLDHLAAGVDGTYVVGSTYTVYASEQSMYLATRFWSDPRWQYHLPDEPTATTATHVHEFDVASDPAHPAYVASGTIAGEVHNQFSLDEHEGVLRVATSAQLQADESWRPRESSVYTLRREGGSLALVGALTGLAPGEDIYAVRFVGDTGYVVTFRQYDPLFVVDLSAPSTPRLLGELHIPGFSEYMHPIEDGQYLLTIGEDMGGTALQIFDVRDPREPKLAHKEVLSGYSEAETEHKAFTFWHGMLAIPFSGYYGSWSSELLLFDIDATSGIRPLGKVDHSSLFASAGSAGYGCYPAAGVRRGVFIEDHVYSISAAGILANRLGEDQMVSPEPTATLAFSPATGDCYY